MAPGSWLPALPNGTSLGPRPAALPQRYVDLYDKFGAAWRVTGATSLFDYAPGTSAATFAVPSWPLENPPCVLPDIPQVKPLNPLTAQQLCRPVVDKNRKADCVFDVTVTGEPGFAKTYLLTERIKLGSTTTTVKDNQDPTQSEEPVTFTAIVARKALSGRGAPTGTVQFILDGSRAGLPVKLANGRATWKTRSLKPGEHKVAARYIPVKGSVFLASSSPDKPHTVRGTPN